MFQGEVHICHIRLVLSVFKHADIYLLGLAKTSKQSGTEAEFVSDALWWMKLASLMCYKLGGSSLIPIQSSSKQLSEQKQWSETPVS